jgi:hypothetical protein
MRGSPNWRRPASPATCHSSSVGSRTPAHVAYARASASSTWVTDASGAPRPAPSNRSGRPGAYPVASRKAANCAFVTSRRSTEKRPSSTDRLIVAGACRRGGSGFHSSIHGASPYRPVSRSRYRTRSSRRPASTARMPSGTASTSTRGAGRRTTARAGNVVLAASVAIDRSASCSADMPRIRIAAPGSSPATTAAIPPAASAPPTLTRP